eukprot:9389396-Alexandrium_andersonii.AAC.1
MVRGAPTADPVALDEAARQVWDEIYTGNVAAQDMEESARAFCEKYARHIPHAQCVAAPITQEQ